MASQPRNSIRSRLQLCAGLLLIFLIGCSTGPGNGPTAPPDEPASTGTAAAANLTAAPTRTAPPSTDISPATSSPTPTSEPSATPVPSTTILFTGNIVPARCVQAKIDELGNPDYPYEEVTDLIQGADLAIGTLNGTISDVPELTGCTRTFLLVGRSENAAALSRAGFDAMSTATNHIKNCGLGTCGDKAFLETLANLRAAGIQPIGAGKNLAEALKSQVFVLNGIRFAVVSLGEIESMAFATEDSPGIAVLDEANLRSAIQAAQEVGDVVIVLPHWGPEYSVDPNYRQLNFAQIAVEAGADLVVGNHTHTVQAFETIGGVPVFYGLGNFMFDQGWSEETSQGLALIVTFEGKNISDFQFVPVHIDSDGRVHIAETGEAQEILQRIREANERLR